MYAIIRAGGHQEKVSAGDTITVDRLKTDVGEEVRYVPLMVHKDDGTVVSDHKELGETAAVIGRVLEHTREDKIDVFQYRQKTGYRRHLGHRQPVTLVEIAEIRFGEVVERAEDKKPESAPEPQAEEKEGGPVQSKEKTQQKAAREKVVAKPKAKGKAPLKRQTTKKTSPKRP
jgi:large subunit ribosomal protein L21